MKELIILVGPPGAGKTSLRYDLLETNLSLEGITFVSQDDQGKKDHFDIFQQALIENTNIVVDRMNFNKEQRSRYLEPAKSLGYKTKIIVLHESYDTCLKRCIERQDHPTIKDEEIAKKALHTFFTKYERPTSDEADEIEFRYPEGNKPEAIICDLDGTLCNIDHRLHYVKREPVTIADDMNSTIEKLRKKPDWKSFFEGIKDDTLNTWCDDIIYNLRHNKKYKVVLCSGRPNDYRESTTQWLQKNFIMYDDLFMRFKNDYRKDDIVKEILLDFEILTRYKPVFAIDDRDQVVKMWRKRGFTCLQVADGNF